MNILATYFMAIFNMLKNNTVPGFNIDFWTFYVLVLIIYLACKFIGNFIGIALRSDENHQVSKLRHDQVTTMSQTFNGDGKLVRTTFTKSHR